MGSIKNRNAMDLTEAEDVKKGIGCSLCLETAYRTQVLCIIQLLSGLLKPSGISQEVRPGYLLCTA